MEENKETLAENTDVANAPSELDALRAELTAMADKYLRAVAETENTKRRAGIDAENIARARGMAIAENFLGLIDAIDAGLVHEPGDENIIAMARAATGALTKNGIVRIETVGQPLNPQFHNAVSTESALDAAGKPVAPNIITQELQSGYMFGDTVLRPAVVIVAK